jgi:hypothetical protein
MAKTCPKDTLQSKTFPTRSICEDRLFRTGVLDGQKTANNIDDSIGLHAVKDIKGLIKRRVRVSDYLIRILFEFWHIVQVQVGKVIIWSVVKPFF